MKKLNIALMTIGTIFLFITVIAILVLKTSNIYLILLSITGCIIYYIGMVLDRKEKHITPIEYMKKYKKWR